MSHDASVAKLPKVSLWHSQLGHMSVRGMEELSHLGYIPSLKFSEMKNCEHCIYGKQNVSS